MKPLVPLALLLLACAAPAFGQFSISSPWAGESVPSPFPVSVSDTSCGRQPVVGMIYSLDSISQMTTVNGNSLSTTLAANPGSHILYLGAFSSSSTCVTSVSFTVAGGTPAAPGGVTVSTPAAHAQVATPFALSATSASCSSAPVKAMGYSIDSQPDALLVQEQSIAAQVKAATGSHLLHVKAWSAAGVCVKDVPITAVVNPAGAVPPDAVVYPGLAQATNWLAAHDDATGSGITYGDMEFVATPSLTGNALQFTTTFTNSAGERYSDVFGSNTFAHNFLYDGWVYIASPVAGLANLELDLNQVLANGNTVILAMQCDGYSGTWDYGKNAGTVLKSKAGWVHSSQKCNPRSWSANAWHHVQISESRDDAGNVTYHSVWLDGVQQTINATVPGEFSLGWASVLLTNLQVDGLGSSGQVTLDLDDLTVYAW